jgi:hypothetical protein
MLSNEPEVSTPVLRPPPNSCTLARDMQRHRDGMHLDQKRAEIH